MAPLQIIDAHVHLGRWRHPGFLGLESDLVTTVARLRTDGVDGVALTTSDEGDNDALLAAGRACPLPHWLFLWARPDGADALEALLDDADSAAQGLKLHPSLEQVPLSDPRWDPIFELARRRGLRLMIHTGRWQQAAGYGLALDRAARWPDVQLILSHAGGDTPELCTAAADAVASRKLDNVAFDMAGVREHWALVQAIKRAGHQRYMMGSDFPLAPPAMYIAQVRAMPISDDWKADLLGGNALRLLGPSAPPAAASVNQPTTQPAGLSPEVTSRWEQTLLVTGAGGPLGCNVTRSLRLCRTPVRLIGTDANPYHRPLALTDRCLAVPRAGDPGYLGRINQIVEEEGVDVVVPTHPVEVRALSAVRDQVRAKLFLPPHEAILAGQDKWRSWQRFSAAGVPVPLTIKIDAPADVERAFAELGEPPLWFRGSGVPGAGIGLAALPCRSVEHARFWVDHHDGWGKFMASEYLPGDNLTWLSVWADGTLWGSQTRERLEYVIPHVSPSGITGAPAVCRTVSRPTVRAAGEAAVRAIFDGCDTEPHGIFFVDLKCDAAGTARVIEINSGRFGTTIHFYTAAGFNFPELALQLCLGQLPDSPRHDPIAAGTYWLRTLDCGPVLLTGEAWLKA